MAGRWLGRASFVVLCVLIGVLAACGSTGGPAGSGSAGQAATSAPETSATAEASVPTCLSDAEVRRNLRRVEVPGGGTRQAAEWGSGSVGVLLSHQSDGDLCQWHDYAVTLAHRGYRALALSYQDATTDEALAAVKTLRRDGATSVVLLGASMGGTISLATAARMRPPPAAVISLSGPRAFNSVDALAGVRKLRTPLFLAAGGLDEPFASDARTLYRGATHASTRRLVIESGSGAHGVAFLDGGTVQTAMEAFLARFAPPRA